MDTLTMLQVAWFFLVGILFTGYAVLDGFDLGIGTLLPFFARDDRETRALLNTIGPLWDGNEVWLVTAGGALFAAFPLAYATVFSGFYLALMLVIFGLIFRAVSIEFWMLDEPRRQIWRAAFAAGSAIPSLLFGVALGNVLQGIPLNAEMDFTGDFFTLLRPYPLSIGLLGFTAILMQGMTWAAYKSFEDIRSRAREWGKRIWILYMLFLFLALMLGMAIMPEQRGNLPAWICTVATLLSLLLLRRFLATRRDLPAFVMSSLSFAGLWGITASLQFPVLVRALDSPGLSLTISNSSSSLLTLKLMFIVAIVGMPVVIGYTIFVYRLFRGKTS